jgi:hypothetical protein
MHATSTGLPSFSFECEACSSNLNEKPRLRNIWFELQGKMKTSTLRGVLYSWPGGAKDEHIERNVWGGNFDVCGDENHQEMRPCGIFSSKRGDNTQCYWRALCGQASIRIGFSGGLLWSQYHKFRPNEGPRSSWLVESLWRRTLCGFR